MLRMESSMSVRMVSTKARIWQVVPMLIPPWPFWNDPAPIEAACVSFTPAKIWVSDDRPICSATSFRIGPRLEPTGTRSGSFSRSIPQRSSRSSW
jgi:hypothetical protein